MINAAMIGNSFFGALPFGKSGTDVTSLVIAGIFLISGLLLGYALRSLIGRWQAEAIEKKMQLRMSETETEIKAKLKDAELSARAQMVKAREEFENSTKRQRTALSEAGEKLDARSEALQKKSESLAKKEEELGEKAAQLAESIQKAKNAESEAGEKMAMADLELEKVASLTKEEARKQVYEKAQFEMRSDVDVMQRNMQDAAKADGERQAAEIVADAIQRCAVSSINELTTSSVPLPSPDMKGRVVGKEGRNARTFEAATGVSILLDDVPDTVVLSSFDPQRREIARMAMETLLADGRIHPAAIEEAVTAAKAKMQRITEKFGEDAIAKLSLTGINIETVRLLGSLHFRYSFSQNVLKHSMEVACIMGTMAAELHLDASLARRVGLLHDIGKVIASESNGSHAAVGAAFLKAHGESDDVVRAVAAHHGETGTDGGAYGVLCAAADAISSARPGARIESLGSYVERVTGIEKIARAHDGVTNVFAVQAGRDLRVIVDAAKVDDIGAAALARAICGELSAQVKIPGQIKVTVIREFRSIEYAK